MTEESLTEIANKALVAKGLFENHKAMLDVKDCGDGSLEVGIKEGYEGNELSASVVRVAREILEEHGLTLRDPDIALG